MTEDFKHEAFVNIMEFMESLDNMSEVFNNATTVGLEDMTPELWAALQGCMGVSVEYFALIRIMFQKSAMVIDNDALMSHIDAVVTAEE